MTRRLVRTTGGSLCIRSFFWDVQILLQKWKVAGLRIFLENQKREAIANSYLNRVIEVACEFKRETMRSPTSLHESRTCSPQNF